MIGTMAVYGEVYQLSDEGIWSGDAQTGAKPLIVDHLNLLYGADNRDLVCVSCPWKVYLPHLDAAARALHGKAEIAPESRWQFPDNDPDDLIE